MVTAISRRSPRSAPSAVQPKRRNYLAEIVTTAKPRPTSAVLYGPPGIGKTSFGAAMPDCVFLVDDQEDGINTLKSSNLIAPDTPVLPPASHWLDVLGALEALATGQHRYRTLVIDTLGGIERLCHSHVCQRDFNGIWGEKGFASYNKGYEVALPDWRLFLNLLDRLRNERHMAVICLAHSQVRSFRNSEGEDFDRFVPDLHPKTWAVTHRWADMVLFCNFVVETAKEESRAMTKTTRDRRIYTEYHTAYEAKNRHGLPLEIDMGYSGQSAWANLKAALPLARHDDNKQMEKKK